MVLIKSFVDHTDILIIAVFTFQYGSNQIVTESTIHEVLREFTFQYGSNQINVEIKVQYQDFYNLHSNMVLIKFNNFEKITTKIQIYIPIWF